MSDLEDESRPREGPLYYMIWSVINQAGMLTTDIHQLHESYPSVARYDIEKRLDNIEGTIDDIRAELEAYPEMERNVEEEIDPDFPSRLDYQLLARNMAREVRQIQEQGSGNLGMLLELTVEVEDTLESDPTFDQSSGPIGEVVSRE